MDVKIESRAATALLLALACLLPLSGCSVSKSGAGGGGNGQGDTQSGGDAGVLRYVMTLEPTTLDPAKVQDVVTSELLMNIFEPLVRYDEKSMPVPALASSWEISSDGKTYTFHLRADAKFSDGQPLTAADVKYSWERALSPKTASTVAKNYFDGILGLDDVAAGKRPDLYGVVVVDPHTLRVTIDRPRGFFLGMLSYPTGYIVNKKDIEKNSGVVDASVMIGTGPFKLVEYKQGVKVTLQANDSYWGGKPKTDRIEEPIILDPDTNYSNFETGSTDIWPASIPPSRIQQDKQANKFQNEYHPLPTAQVDYLVMHEKLVPEFANKQVREAFALAIDRDTLLRVAYNSVGKRADGFLPPEMPAAGETPPPIPYDPAKAKQLLAQAGYGPGGKTFPRLNLIYRSKAAVAPQACQLIKSNLHDNLGIEIELQEMEGGEFFTAANKDKLAFYYTGWVADYPDPQDFLSTLLVSSASLNHSGYNNPQFDALCRQADEASDTVLRSRLYGQADRILMDDVGVLPIAFTPRTILVHTNVSGWRANLCNVLPNTLTVKK